MSHHDNLAALLEQYIDTQTADAATAATAPLQARLEQAARDHQITRTQLDQALARIEQLENMPPPAPAASPEYGTPRGTKLTTYTGPAVITTDGATYRNTLFPAKVDIRAKDVTIEASRATCPNDVLVMVNKAVNATIRYTTLRPSGQSTNTIGVVGHDFTLDHCDISGTIDGVRIHNTSAPTAPGNVTIRDTWIHDLCWISDGHAGGETHNDGIQIESGNGNINILGGRLSAYGDLELGNILANPRAPHVYSGIMVTPNVGPVSGLLVDGVEFEGGYTHINLAEKGRGALGVIVRNNRFKGDTTTGKDILMEAATRAAINPTAWINNTRTVTRQPIKI